MLMLLMLLTLYMMSILLLMTLLGSFVVDLSVLMLVGISHMSLSHFWIC